MQARSLIDAGAVRTLLLAGSASVMLAGCVTVPRLGQAPEAKPAQAYATAESFKAPDADWPADRWWTAYGDPQLDTLMDEALNGSPTVAQALARVRKAEALAREAKGAVYPAISANEQIALTKQSYFAGFPPAFQAFLPHGWLPFNQESLNLDYQLDLWGQNRKALAAATSEAQAARADAAQVRLALAAGVATAYADLARLYAERDDAQATLEIREKTLKVFAQRGEAGLETRGVVHQSSSNVQTAKAQLAAIDEQIALTRDQLAALLGQGPDRGLKIEQPKVGTLRPLGLPANLPADLIGRRPDITAARLRTEAASNRVGVAKAAFYPNVDLVALVGQEVLGLQFLKQPGSSIGQAGLAVHLPIFDAGRINGAYRGARADYDGAVADYDETLVQALREVADALNSRRALSGQLSDAEAAEAQADKAWKIAGQRYEAGLTNYLAVLSAEDQLVAARRARVDLEARGFSLDVALTRALGGGFHS
jgi:NodT family efflux transporter outer membrane factor (OMF) lipoprotein